jgi:hypothetical protein
MLDKPLNLQELLMLALDHPDAQYDAEKHQPKQALVEKYTDRLIRYSAMLDTNFSIKLDGNSLIGLPILTDCLKPFEQELPMFILRLALVAFTDDLKFY